VKDELERLRAAGGRSSGGGDTAAPSVVVRSRTDATQGTTSSPSQPSAASRPAARTYRVETAIRRRPSPANIM